jgi:hypothetical protein
MSVIAGIVLCAVSSVFAYSGGSGTGADPYQIGTVSDWNDLMNTQSDWDANFVMVADVNLQGIPLIPVGNDLNGTPLFFKGVFDGNGHVIRNAAINMPGRWHIGLFGLTDANSQIRNLGVEDVNMNGERDVAGLVGLNDFGTISNCYVTGKVGQYSSGSSHSCLGGLVGLNYGTITGSHVACDVNGNETQIGGLVGRNTGTIIDSYANATVNGDRYVGGLVGENGYVMGETGAGFDPDFIATLVRCYAKGSVSGNSYVGGLVGKNGDIEAVGIPISITNCYAIAEVTGGAGLIGRNYAGGGRPPHNFIAISNCYAAGRVNGNGGGLVGPGSISSSVNCFWDIEATGQATSGSGTGKTTAEMKTLSTFTSAGWDFSYTDGDPADWFIQIDGYPILTWQISPADLYTDGKNNFRDFAIFAEYWQRKDCAIYNDYCEWADMNFDGHVDINDLVDFISYWLEEGIYWQ